MPQTFTIANFGHPVSKSWLRPWCTAFQGSSTREKVAIQLMSQDAGTVHSVSFLTGSRRSVLSCTMKKQQFRRGLSSPAWYGTVRSDSSILVIFGSRFRIVPPPLLTSWISSDFSGVGYSKFPWKKN